MRRSDVRDVEYILVQWGAWAYSDRGLSLYFPSIATFERMRRSSLPTPHITDAEACRIDRVVSALKNVSPNEYEAFALHYVGRKSYRQIAKMMGTNHKAVSDWVQGGRRFVEGALLGVDLGETDLRVG